MKKKNKRKIGREFPYRLQYCPHPNVMIINARSRFPVNPMAPMDLCHLKRFNKSKKTHPLYLALRRIPGLKNATSSGGYSLQIEKANSLFNWNELLPQVLSVIQTTVAKKQTLTEVGEPERPIGTYLHHLPAQGCSD